jgi:HD superfamily phosphodiesterase
MLISTLRRKKALNSITTIMLVYLPISLIANYYHERYSFVIIYGFIIVATIEHFRCYRSHKNIDMGSNQLMIILFGLFFSFFLLGSQETFDVLWIISLPIVGLVITSYTALKKWIAGFLGLLLLMVILSYFSSEWIRYDTFALFSLLWAGIFVSGIVLYYKQVQNDLEAIIENHQRSLHHKVNKATHEIATLNQSLEATQVEIVERLSTLAEFRSQETGAHVRRVGLYSRHLAHLAGLDETTSQLIEQAAPLHDIGKVGIEDTILHKPAKLTAEEYERMKEHASIGKSILDGSDKPLIQYASQIAGGHHEKYDGTGYPKGLQGEEIPLCARIVSIADAFDALYSRRVYKEEWSIEEIVHFFEQEKGHHFDPRLCELFINNLDAFVKIYTDNK